MPGVRPKIIGDDETIEPVIMRCSYDLPWNRQSTQTACGEVIQTQVGAKNWRVVVEGILTKPQLYTLGKMRDQETVVVVTEEFGRMEVAFDNLNIERANEEAVGEVEGVSGVLMAFQLQTKEQTEGSGEGFQFFEGDSSE